MYSISDKDAVAAADIFKESLTETKVDVEGLQKSMLNSRKWTAHAQSIEDEYQQKSIITKIVVDQEQITVLCTSKGEAGIIREKIQDFFQLNTENEIIIDLPPAQLKFLQEHMKDEVGLSIECFILYIFCTSESTSSAASLTPCWFPLTRIPSLFTATITFFCFIVRSNFSTSSFICS
jgi:hypothetical protein